ncbi:hypothetical protein BCR33DRAFT_854402 [Rhizoclosmatium globosum]|uniref:Nudix hydrolase domain-containing protein n=1 Tax=Rhizoclosmatium globosum TaxID=329046 RepID=A0A1Y2BT75_9FUNG|nr:hypothetical protein BCR33DRAFT_854402 [Rhizoclosmatium globosum]|eukprot:ORY37943.1 hypothetical protein BCR33DRAFT_854402 [Rhizoclosmatium globosum]
MNAAIVSAVRQKALVHATSIKNRGQLNAKFYYFTPDLKMVTNSTATLSDTSSTKYFTIASDMIVFSPSQSHVLMIFRCPHNKTGSNTCASNVLDQASFQYKGCLATPGGFFDANEDRRTDGNPDFKHSATRELNEECSKLFDNENIKYTDIQFLSAEFNNYRDIRWFTSTNYVPTLATQFTTKLIGPANHLPNVKGSDDACGNAYWIDVRIVASVYAQYHKVFDAFDQVETKFDEAKFDQFVKTHFPLNPTTGLPRNKLRDENNLLKNVKPDQYVIDFDPSVDYHYSDFAFDHCHNIVKAQKKFAKKESKDCTIL